MVGWRDIDDPGRREEVEERLAHILAVTAPRRASRPVESATDDASDTSARSPGPSVAVREGEGGPRATGGRRFGRTHFGVVVGLLLVGVLCAGWAVLRARPVALGAPLTAVTTPSAGSGTDGATATGPVSSGGNPTSARSSSPGRGSADPRSRRTGPKTTILVHVLGSVRKPGVVTLPQGARVQDALRAAGGLLGSADPGELNLAQILGDGTQIVIGTRRHPSGEVRGSSAAEPPTGSSPGTTVLGLNTATESELEQLPGVGPVTAAKIIAWRAEHGRFSRVEELQEVDGIGPKTFARIAPHVHP